MKYAKLVLLTMAIGLTIAGCGGAGSSAVSTSGIPSQQIYLSSSGESVVLAEYFSLTTTGESEPNFGTNLSLSYESSSQSLKVNFVNTNDQYIKQNQYTQNNTSMWNQEVFEVFISAGSNTPTEYLELEVNPNNALFSAFITNPDGTGGSSIVYIDGPRNGIISTVESSGENSLWSGTLVIPLQILGDVQTTYRINFFRVVSLSSNTRLDPNDLWACSNISCAYLAWIPTLSGQNPAFHIPQYFAQLNITN